MKTILLIGGTIFLLYGCIEASNPEPVELLSNEEMKARVEVEEIDFEIDSHQVVSNKEDELRLQRVRPIDPGLGGCVFPKSELREDSLPMPPDIQNNPLPEPEEEVFDIPEVAAQYPGGVVELKKFINENIQYPNRDFCIQGRVYVSFVVESEGSITHLQVMRGGIEGLNDEALRLIRSMPKWIPAKNNGKVVAARVRLPINFRLN